MAITLVSSIGAGSTTGTNATTPPIETTGANLIVVFVASDGVQTVSDSKGNTWVGLTSHPAYSNPTSNKLYQCINPVVGTGHTFTVSGSGKPVIIAAAFSGASGGLDLESGAGCAAGNSGVGTGSLTTSVANELVITGVGAAGLTLTINSGFTIITQVALTSNSYEGGLAYLIPASSGTVAGPFWFGVNFQPAGGLSGQLPPLIDLPTRVGTRRESYGIKSCISKTRQGSTFRS